MKKTTLQVQDILRVDIIDLSYEGLGVAKVDGFTVFVAGVLVGEQASIQITQIEKRYAYASLVELHKQSTDRIEVENPNLNNTIPLQHLRYAKQLEFKSKIVKDVFNKHESLRSIKVLDTIGATDIWHYRNKTQVPVYLQNQQMQTGVFVGGTKNLIAVEDFKINLVGIDEVVAKVCKILSEFGEKAYDSRTHTGNIRHIVVRKGEYTNEIMVVIVTRSKSLFPKSKIIPAILEISSNIVSIVHNINNRRTSTVLGEHSEVIYGSATYQERILSKTFDVDANSFLQVNTKQAEVVYQHVIDSLQLTGDEIVLDAYCGIGTMSLHLADKAKHVFGIEILQAAVNMAHENARKNNISNVTFICGDVEDTIDTITSKLDVVVIDPPRKGLETTFLHDLIKHSPTKIAYVSCNPATLARDSVELLKHGYELLQVQPVDMFIQTIHVETIAIFTRK